MKGDFCVCAMHLQVDAWTANNVDGSRGNGHAADIDTLRQANGSHHPGSHTLEIVEDMEGLLHRTIELAEDMEVVLHRVSTRPAKRGRCMHPSAVL